MTELCPAIAIVNMRFVDLTAVLLKFSSSGTLCCVDW
jgi:hypothetical protein